MDDISNKIECILENTREINKFIESNSDKDFIIEIMKGYLSFALYALPETDRQDILKSLRSRRGQS